jgi:long-chain acyl-CoA synthetase
MANMYSHENMYPELHKKRPWIRHYDHLVPPEINFPQWPVYELLFNTANNHPDKIAMWFYETETTYWDLAMQVIRFANALVGIGVKKGDRVGVLLPNSPQFNLAFWGTLTAGAIVVNMNPMYPVDELEFMAKITELETLITYEECVPKIKELTKRVKIPNVIVTKLSDFIKNSGVSTPESLGLEPGWYHFSQILDACGNTSKPRTGVTKDDPAVIQFTGGTTGTPKGATLSHANVVAGIYECAIYGNNITATIPVERLKAFCVLPYYHVYGEVCQMGWCIYSAATQIILPRFEINEVLDTLEKFDDITYFGAVPTMLTAIFNHPRAEKMNLGKKFTFVGNGGGPCPVELINRLLDMNVYYSEGWGMSETTSVGIANPDFGLKKPLSVGVPVPNMDIRIIDPETGEDVPQGTPGELLVKGPYVMMGYWNNPEETAQQLTEDGWLHTGDVVYQDEDGYIFIVDRTKDMIIAGGFNIYMQEVDRVIMGHPKVADVICCGIPDEYRGETLKAFIQLKPGATATEEEIIAFCREKMAAYKVPKMVEFRPELPRSAVGKALRRVLREEEIAKMKSK